MADNLADRVLDLGLNVLDTEATHIYICSAEPTTHTEATSTYALGEKDFGAGNAVGSPGAGTPNGRKVDTVAVTDGTTTADGDATDFAITDDANSRLLAVGTISPTKAVLSGNNWAMGSVTIRIPNQ